MRPHKWVVATSRNGGEVGLSIEYDSEEAARATIVEVEFSKSRIEKGGFFADLYTIIPTYVEDTIA